MSSTSAPLQSGDLRSAPVKTSSFLTGSTPSSDMKFLIHNRVPIEVREMIYTLVLKTRKENNKIVSSPRRTQEYLGDWDSLTAILGVSKSTYAEAIQVLYKINKLVIGNGPWSSKTIANLHAFKVFKSHMNVLNLAFVQQLKVQAYLVAEFWGGRLSKPGSIDLKPRPWVDKSITRDRGIIAIKDLRLMIQNVKKHFPNIRKIEFEIYAYGGNWNMNTMPTHVLIDSDNGVATSAALYALFAFARLEDLIVCGNAQIIAVIRSMVRRC